MKCQATEGASCQKPQLMPEAIRMKFYFENEGENYFFENRFKMQQNARHPKGKHILGSKEKRQLAAKDND